jgi:hypothetical protein
LKQKKERAQILVSSTYNSNAKTRPRSKKKKSLKMKIHARIRIQVHKDNQKQIHRSDEGSFFICLPE